MSTQSYQFEYGQLEQVAPRIRRIVAHNPSMYTYYGTGTYIIGERKVAVVDPGPADPAHIQSLVDALPGETITHILVTHTHCDHSPGCELLLKHCEATVYGFGPHGSREHSHDEEGSDLNFVPDIYLDHNDIIIGDGWTVRSLHTPGHLSNHMCFLYEDQQSLFSGDHVMGWATTVISPPDGDLHSYLNSLQLLLELDAETYWPTHGPAITEPKRYVKELIQHRLMRAEQIKEQLTAGLTRIRDIVLAIYTHVDPILHPAAARSVLSTLLYLIRKGEVRSAEPINEKGEFFLN